MGLPADRERVAAIYGGLLREWLARREPAWVPIVGDSMAPTLPRGTRVLVVGLDGRAPRAGDVVVYETDEALVCHRVLRRGAGRVLARGDAWRAIASWVPTAAILGRVVEVERRGVRLDLDTPRGRLAGRLVAAASRALDRIVPPLRTLRWKLGR